MCKTDFFNYYLRDRNGRVVYRGVSRRPSERAQEHRDDGKKFAYLETVGNGKTWAEARHDERRALARHVEREGHQPKYNIKWGGLRSRGADDRCVARS